MATPALNRRTLLEAIAGAAVPLPFLHSLIGSTGRSLASGLPLPRRYLVCFGGYSLATDGTADPSPDRVIPRKLGRNYDLPEGLRPLAAIQDYVTVVSGLTIPVQSSPAGAIPPAGFAGPDFHWHNNPLLAGRRSVASFDDTLTGPTSDQVVADAIGSATRFRSLAFRIQASPYLSGGGIETTVNHGCVSAKRDGSGNIVPVVPVTSPRAAFEELFLDFPGSDPRETARRRLEIIKRKSVLDVVDRSLRGLHPRLGRGDRTRLDQHWDEIREIEKRLGLAPATVGGSCHEPVAPGEDPPVGGSLAKPDGFDANAGYSNEDLRARLFCDLTAIALACDLTRAASLMFTLWQSFMNSAPVTGSKLTLHELNHRGKIPDLTAAIAWHMKHFAYLLGKLRGAGEGDGNVLDRSAVLFLNEGGNGLDCEVGVQPDKPRKRASHTTEGMIALVAGRAGGLTSGVHLAAPSGANHPAHVLVTAMNAVGVQARSLGEVTGVVPGLGS